MLDIIYSCVDNFLCVTSILIKQISNIANSSFSLHFNNPVQSLALNIICPTTCVCSFFQIIRCQQQSSHVHVQILKTRKK